MALYLLSPWQHAGMWRVLILGLRLQLERFSEPPACQYLHQKAHQADDTAVPLNGRAASLGPSTTSPSSGLSSSIFQRGYSGMAFAVDSWSAHCTAASPRSSQWPVERAADPCEAYECSGWAFGDSVRAGPMVLRDLHLHGLLGRRLK